MLGPGGEGESDRWGLEGMLTVGGGGLGGQAVPRPQGKWGSLGVATCSLEEMLPWYLLPAVLGCPLLLPPTPFRRLYRDRSSFQNSEIFKSHCYYIFLILLQFF